jgi:signal transduction histidine kinase
MDAPSLHVLLVEDEVADALRVQRCLRLTEAGRPRYQVRQARTLAAGLAELRSPPVDAVLLDLGLPDSDGATTVEQIRLRDAKVPVVVITGSEDPGLARRAFAAGADEYLAKGDLGTALLRRTIAHAIERRRLCAEPQRALAPLPATSDRALWHHLKNLHTCILGNAQLLERELGEREFLARRAAALVAAARSAVALAQQLVAGSGGERRRAVDLAELVRGAEPLLHALIPEGIELRLEIAASLPPAAARVEGLCSLLFELVRNAAEAIEAPPGRIAVRAGTVALEHGQLPGVLAPRGLRLGPHVWLEVHDTGPGFEAAELPRLLEDGYSSKGPGRGHGLSHLLETLAEHRGALQVRSQAGLGSTFRILLPCAGAGSAPHSDAGRGEGP